MIRLGTVRPGAGELRRSMQRALPPLHHQRPVRRQGKRAETRQLLEDTYGWFTEGFDTADLQEAKTLLGALR
jgi:hypothetical protein